MKNQYVGDVGDYGKYAMLRFFALKGISVGVNWYLTKNDDSNDGKHITYLEKQEYREYCPEVFDGMKRIIESGNRNVSEVEKLCLIPEAVYYNDVLYTNDYSWDERKAIRDRWHRKAMEVLSSTELVFADPDNGTIGVKSKTSKDAEKYALQREITDYYDRGQNVVYYCHKARRNEQQWGEKKNEMLKFLPDAQILVLTFHRGTQRSYIFVVHPNSYKRYRELINEFVTQYWKDESRTPAFVME